MAAGGWWFAGSGWVQPPSLCAASLAAAGTRVRAQFGRPVARLQRDAEGWRAIAADGSTIAAAPVVVLAAGGLFYTVGIVFYAFDSRFRHWHGIWHLFVIGGSLMHYLTIALYVI